VAVVVVAVVEVDVVVAVVEVDIVVVDVVVGGVVMVVLISTRGRNKFQNLENIIYIYLFQKLK
jgi:hypothetical protein